jgi:choice-of-anchor B domain-containing protein
MQVMDLLQLDGIVNPPVMFTELAHYPNFGNAHNIAINEETGFAYAVGSQTYAGGLHFINIQDPANPLSAGGFEQDGYTHDVQVVIYQGSDPDYFGKEIAFASNEDTFTIIDVDDKSDPFQVSRTSYVGNRYAHQGWLTEDHNYFLHNDELDELEFGHNTRTYVWDIHDLDAPILLGYYESTSGAIDHNLYVKGNHVYLANYTSGLRVLRLNDISTLDIEEVGFFDIIPGNDDAQFAGSWNVYPFFESGTMILSNMYVGFYVLQPDFDPLMSAVKETENHLFEIFPNPAKNQITIRFEGNISTPIEIYDFTGKRVLLNSTSSSQQGSLMIDISSLNAGMYLVRAEGQSRKLVVN